MNFSNIVLQQMLRMWLVCAGACMWSPLTFMMIGGDRADFNGILMLSGFIVSIVMVAKVEKHLP